MSPVPFRSTLPRRATLVAGMAATAALALVPTGATAAGPPVFNTLQTVVQAGVGSTAAGNGHVAWAVREGVDETDGHATNVATSIWTLRDGAPVKVATITDVGGYGADLEVGTAKAGVPVVVVTTVARDEKTEVRRIVRLDTGAATTLPGTRKGRVVGGVAVDNGRIYWGLRDKKTTTRTTSTLYRATLSGTTSGTLHEVQSTQTGVTITGLFADRYRIALDTTRKLPGSASAAARLEIWFGVPQGRWNATGRNDVDAGAFRPFDVVGFTQDRNSLVTAQQEENGPLALYSTAIGGGRSKTIARLGVDEQDDGIGPGQLEAGTGRLFTNGKGPDGVDAVGYSAPVVPVTPGTGG